MPSTYTITASVTWNNLPYPVTGKVSVPDAENTALPIVVLLHGTSGDDRDMASPGEHPGFNYNRNASIPSVIDRGWRSYPGVSIWSHQIDPPMPVTGWERALNTAGFRTVNYKQVQPRGSLQIPTAQLSALMRALIADSRHAGRSFVLLGHSRGGLLARALAIEAGRRGAFDIQRLKRVVTLHAPNQGSSLANAAIAVSDLTRVLNTIVGPLGREVIRPLIQFIQEEAGAMAYRDYAIGSSYLANLAAQEPVSGVRYATFGGNSAILTRHRFWAFTPDSALPRWHLPPFRWRTVPLSLGNLMPPSLPIPLPNEFVHGTGDTLVTDSNARLPSWAPHRTNSINHAEALWNPALQQQVITLLKSA